MEGGYSTSLSAMNKCVKNNYSSSSQVESCNEEEIEGSNFIKA